jgi:hypothetical protein
VTDSGVLGISGGQQSGWIRLTSGRNHASLWSGTAQSWIDLHPPGEMESVGYGAAGGYQVGYVRVNSGVTHAAVWRGTAASWFDLHDVLPAGTNQSEAYGVATDGVQIYVVGFAVGEFTGHQNHAVLWSVPYCQVEACCLGDYNQDGGIDGADVEAFFADWEAGAAGGDVNADGGIDGGDVEFFFGRWEGGC